VDETKPATNATKPATNATKPATDLNDPSEDEQVILAAIRKKPELTQKQLHDATEIPLGTIKRILPRLQAKGKLERVGNRRQGYWKIMD
ncbi:MAG: winged helix-turn-helix transcriptional regulator, partial [Lachnospiraceae bacterium]|nr:winged helix-turn-helix transcriptional regulator [Lachnospiraceae bacterium]